MGIYQQLPQGTRSTSDVTYTARLSRQVPCPITDGAPTYGLMVKKTVFETGFKGSPAVPTVTPAVPEVARSAGVMVAVSCELLLKEVALSLVFQSTTELEAKFDPFTVNRIAGLPAGAFVGEIEVICGVGGVRNVGPPHPGSSKVSPKAAKTRRQRCMMCSWIGRHF